ncbi:MAG: hypothetical protein ACF787_01255 [Rhodopirellula sp. JB053]
MRKLILIVGCIIAVIFFDVVMGTVSRLLPTQAQATIGGWGMTASWTVIPAAFVFTPAKRNWPLRLFLATVVSWYEMLLFRMQYDLPATRELARERGDHMHDCVGMNAAVLVTGWIPPLIVTAVLIVVYSGFARLAGRTHDGASRTSPGSEATEP